MEMPTLTQFPDEIIFTKCPHCTDIVFQVFCLAKGHVPVVYFCAMLFSPTGQFCLCLNRNLGLEAGGPVVIQGAKKNGSFSYYPAFAVGSYPAPESIQAKRWLLLCCSCSWASVDNMRAKTDLLYIILHNDSLVIDSYVSVVNCVGIISNL